MRRALSYVLSIGDDEQGQLITEARYEILKNTTAEQRWQQLTGSLDCYSRNTATSVP